MNRAAAVSLRRWLRRQLAQPLPARERLEAAVEHDDPAEVRRLLAEVPFTPEQRRHVDGLLDAWEEETRRPPLVGRAALEQQRFDP